MSRITVQTETPTSSRPDADLYELASLVRRAMATAVRGGKPLLDAYGRMLRQVLSTPDRPCVPECTIPETECPPYCVCRMGWEARRCEELRGTIRVTNTGTQARPFHFEATSFRGSAGDTGVVPSLSPTSALLKVGESETVTVALHVDDKFRPSAEYKSEVKVRGAYEQCVLLELKVLPDHEAHCEVQQGEVPTRIRAHRWYHHFQCEEPCFEPIRQTELVEVEKVLAE